MKIIEICGWGGLLGPASFLWDIHDSNESFIDKDKMMNAVTAYREKAQFKDKYGVSECVDWAQIGWNWTGKFTGVPKGCLNLTPNSRNYPGILTLQDGRTPAIDQAEAILDVLGEAKAR